MTVFQSICCVFIEVFITMHRLEYLFWTTNEEKDGSQTLMEPQRIEKKLLTILFATLVAGSLSCDTDDDGYDAESQREGDDPGECNDGADNDLDGRFDCDDSQCVGSPVCEDSSPSGPTGKTAGASCSETYTLICGSSADGTQTEVALYCNAGVYQQVFTCPPLQECRDIVGHSSIRCGEDGVSYALSGAPCANEGGATCSFDGTIVQSCSSGIWVDAIHCPPSECMLHSESSTSGGGIACANKGYSVGDMCQFSAGGVVCSTDLSSILQCANGRTTVHTDCGSRKCTFVGEHTLDCV